jgi:DNA-binding FrmR family transcriptional regulator
MMNERQKEDVQKRLGKIEGQIRGISRMVSDDRYCMDVLTQIRAITAGMHRVEDIIMEQHLHTCVMDSFRRGTQTDKNEKITEIMQLISALKK